MRRISLGALPALLTVAMMGLAIGCGDDDDNGPVDPQDAGEQGGECLDRLQERSPGTPAACNECLCDNCEAQLEACDEDPDCQDEVECAQDAIGDGTCVVDPANLQDTIDCLETACDVTFPTDPSAGLLLCIQASCSVCVPGEEPGDDAGVEDAGTEDAGTEEDASVE